MLHDSVLFAPICALGLTAAVSAPASAEILYVTTPFAGPRGDYVTQPDRYHTFRIPGMVVAADGAILAFAEGRRGDGDDPRRDANAPIDVVMRRSTTLGRTWEDLVVIDSGFRPGGSLVDFGDPTPVVDAAAETVFLFYGQFPDVGPIYCSVGQNPSADSGNHVVWVRSSSDHGRTWSERRQVVYPDQPSATSDGLYWRHAEPGPGNGIQLQWQQVAGRNGRLLIPARRAGSDTPDGPVTVEPFVYYSDDHGQTWQFGSVTPGPDGNESEVVELTDGRLLLDARQNSGDFRRRHRSTDGGLSWDADRPAEIPLPRVDASLARFSARPLGHERDQLLFAAPRGRQGLNRRGLTLWSSFDEGDSFQDPLPINEDFAAYSVVVRLPDGSVGLLAETAEPEEYEDDPYGNIKFYRVNLTER